jgi:hypothetical protein
MRRIEIGECEGIRLLNLADRCRWRAFLATTGNRKEGEARYTAGADDCEAQVLTILERSCNTIIPEP